MSCTKDDEFTSVVDLSKNSPYMEKYVQVAWCHYSHVPEKTEKLYVQIWNRNSNDKEDTFKS